jgi:hypothetical protein
MIRFYAKMNKSPSGCWNWTAALRGKTGYGAFKFEGKVIDAHRMSYMIFKGPITEGMYVCHSCDNRRCVNPDHLFLGTPKQNHQDSVDKGRMHLPKREKIPHPSYQDYKRGCRCAECTLLARDAVRLYRLNRVLRSS